MGKSVRSCLLMKSSNHFSFQLIPGQWGKTSWVLLTLIKMLFCFRMSFHFSFHFCFSSNSGECDFIRKVDEQKGVFKNPGAIAEACNSKYFREAILLDDHAQGGLGISQQHSGNSLSSPEVCLPVWESSENGLRPEIQKPR